MKATVLLVASFFAQRKWDYAVIPITAEKVVPLEKTRLKNW